jgi:hypothetical protein
VRRYSRIDASLCSFLAVCGQCGYRGGPAESRSAADELLLRHQLDAHPVNGRQRVHRERVHA